MGAHIPHRPLGDLAAQELVNTVESVDGHAEQREGLAVTLGLTQGEGKDCA